MIYSPTLGKTTVGAAAASWLSFWASWQGALVILFAAITLIALLRLLFNKKSERWQ